MYMFVCGVRISLSHTHTLSLTPPLLHYRYNLDCDDPEMRTLVENHKLFETGYARILLPRGA